MEGAVQVLVAANPEQVKGTEDGVVNPTVGRYLEDLVNGNNAYEDPVINGPDHHCTGLTSFPDGFLLRVN